MTSRRQRDELHGWYRADEVGRLAGVSGARIGQWARRGYIRSSRSSTRPRQYSYQDVAEAILVHRLLDEGVPQRWIRRTIEALRAEYGDWPLQQADLVLTAADSEGSRRIHYRKNGLLLDASATADQGVAQVLAGMLVEVVDLLSRGGWAATKLTELHHIEVDPFRLSGRPVIRGRRVAVEDVVTIMGEEVDGRSLLKADYGLKDDEIDEALAWWRATDDFALAA